jgi:hypothetical protein
LYAEGVQQVLDENGNGDINSDRMVIKVVKIGRDRKAISASMRDVGQAIGVFDQILVVVLLIITTLIFGMWSVSLL